MSDAVPTVMEDDTIAGDAIDLAMPTFVRVYPPAVPPPGPTTYLPFRAGELITDADFHLLREPFALASAKSVGQSAALYIGSLDDVPCLAYEVSPDLVVPEGFRCAGLRSLYGQVTDAEYSLAGYASQLLNWRTNYVYCSRCRTAAEPLNATWGMVCPNCRYASYPPVSPAVLALVHDGADRVLLAKKPGWGRRFSILAGFVEPGESLEECVAREVFEEAGVHVRDIEYVGSQSWPFPHQIMVGFHARYAAGEIRIQEDELEEASWFAFDELPELPPPLSLSRRIIDGWVTARQNKGAKA